jgi:hypothetical protein
MPPQMAQRTSLRRLWEPGRRRFELWASLLGISSKAQCLQKFASCAFCCRVGCCPTHAPIATPAYQLLKFNSFIISLNICAMIGICNLFTIATPRSESLETSGIHQGSVGGDVTFVITESCCGLCLCNNSIKKYSLIYLLCF